MRKENFKIRYLQDGRDFCPICKKEKENKDFLKSKIDNKTLFCKECLKIEVGENLEKAIPYLHQYDVPICPRIWNKKCHKNIINYLYTMNMFSFRHYHFPEIIFITIEDIEPLTKEEKEEISFLKATVINYLNKELWENNKCLE